MKTACMPTMDLESVLILVLSDDQFNFYFKNKKNLKKNKILKD